MELTKRSGLRAGIGLALLVAVSPMLTACDEPAAAVAAQPAAPPDVSYIAVKPQPFAIMRELPGRIAPTADMLDAIIAGDLEAAFTWSGYAAAKAPVFGVFGTVPFGPGPEDMTSWMLEGDGSRIHREAYEKLGVVGIPCGIQGAKGGGWFRSELDTVADFKGQRLRFGRFAGEVMAMRGIDLDTSGPVWTYRPRRHKNLHRGQDRVIFLGPQAQQVLKPFLKPDPQAYLFSPRDYVEALHARRAALRKTKRTPSELKKKRVARPRRKPAERYNRRSYRLAVVRACAKAQVPAWSPY